jgi:hypothetical protein
LEAVEHARAVAEDGQHSVETSFPHWTVRRRLSRTHRRGPS